jgi:hypothetical protein
MIGSDGGLGGVRWFLFFFLVSMAKVAFEPYLKNLEEIPIGVTH